ncbi:uncharacterized protein LOC110180369 [Drosophila serrata]|uniref:uncharacterized protein LOC110180369 n=1 Tax=Drosophila serrata TaxID=7274 RepID=UPI000A1CF40D|nr:uncharacterized protein LOC110180369 [Drosophila serrata]XP_020803694.1 uncharacterized protein LOC110180369 [Drosophila serrata]XP_020803696.1 uncharacterized protein LOC110180369 [Drosophila serrata]
MEEHVVALNSWRTSNSTITLKDFHQLGITDGYKYVPKAHEIKPPFIKDVKLPSKNMNLIIVTDKMLFMEHFKDLAPLFLEKDQQQVKTIPNGSSVKDSSTKVNNSPKSDSDCDSMECLPDQDILEYSEVKVSSPQEHNLDMQSNGLDKAATSEMNNSNLTDIPMEDSSDCDSMECLPDKDFMDYSDIKLYSPEEYNPWQPEM